MLDLSVLTEPGVKICVRCTDEESTLAFLDEMFLQYPEKCRYWSRGENKWGDRETSYVDYFPYLNNYDGRTLFWGSDGYAESNGYKIIKYYDIPGALGAPADLGEILCSEFDISALF